MKPVEYGLWSRPGAGRIPQWLPLSRDTVLDGLSGAQAMQNRPVEYEVDNGRNGVRQVRWCDYMRRFAADVQTKTFCGSKYFDTAYEVLTFAEHAEK